jgi:hypothetical protein
MNFGFGVVTLASHVSLPTSPNSHVLIGFHPLLSGNQGRKSAEADWTTDSVLKGLDLNSPQFIRGRQATKHIDSKL